jgi:hypothetical protein
VTSDANGAPGLGDSDAFGVSLDAGGVTNAEVMSTMEVVRFIILAPIPADLWAGTSLVIRG